MNFKQRLLGLRFLFLIRILAEKKIPPMCRVDGRFDLTGIISNGDVNIGGMFSVNYVESHPDLSFRDDPGKLQCTGFSVRDFQCVQTMIFATEEINRSNELLPNMSLGYRIYDICYTHFQATRAAVSLISGTGDRQDECAQAPLVPVIIGGAWSTQSIAVSRVVALFNIPMISYVSTCACLSNKHEYPTFLRTISSDLFQSQALTLLINHFRWTWIGLIIEDNDYGQNAGSLFKEEVTKLGICIAFIDYIPAPGAPGKIRQSVRNIMAYNVKVVLIIASELLVVFIFQEVVYQNLTGVQWIASDAWSTSSFVYKKTYTHFSGTIGFSIRRGDIAGLSHFLANTHLSQKKNNPLIANLWEETFNCSLDSSFYTSKLPCTGLEDLSANGTQYLDVTNLRISYNVYKAIYTVAHALHNLIISLGFNRFLRNRTLNNMISPWIVSYISPFIYLYSLSKYTWATSASRFIVAH